MSELKHTEKYSYRVYWSEEDQCHLAHCLEFPSLTAHATSIEGALKEIKLFVSESIKWLEEEKETVPTPLGQKSFKGNFTLRLPPALHRKITIESAEQGISINKYILSKIGLI